MFAILVKFTVSPEYRKQLIDALNEDRRGSLRDERKKGTIRFDIVYDAKNSNIFFLYEVYED
ncbi:MAG: antibiotic biosynthesis monooxygenase [Planctomycetia bacterium]|nr:antibiotic biosynthesis monooxygenase [Planctomycetia bacterium]